jgi:hypothetical protein
MYHSRIRVTDDSTALFLLQQQRVTTDLLSRAPESFLRAFCFSTRSRFL